MHPQTQNWHLIVAVISINPSVKIPVDIEFLTLFVERILECFCVVCDNNDNF